MAARRCLPVLLIAWLIVKAWLTVGVDFGKDEAAYAYWAGHLDATYALLPLGAIAVADYAMPRFDPAPRLVFGLAGVLSVLLLCQLCRDEELSLADQIWAVTAFATSHWIWHTSSFLHPDGFLVPCWLLCLVAARRAATDARPTRSVSEYPSQHGFARLG